MPRKKSTSKDAKAKMLSISKYSVYELLNFYVSSTFISKTELVGMLIDLLDNESLAKIAENIALHIHSRTKKD